MKENFNRQAIILIDSLSFLSYNQKRELLELAGEPSCILQKDFLLKIENHEKFDKLKQALTGQNLELVLEQVSSCKVITYLDVLYPQSFLDLQDYPLCLYCLGDTQLLNSYNTIAVVGSRKTLPQAIKFTSKIAEQLCKEKVVVTGDSSGVEQETILATNGQNTICFLACGINKVSNKDLFKSALVITEYYPTFTLRGYQYIERNRLIASFSQEILIVSGSEKSGVRYTLEFAQENYKTIYALPYNVGEVSGELCNKAIKNGAILVDKLADLVTQKVKQQPLTSQEQLIFNLIEQGITQEDEIIEQSGLGVEIVLQCLVTLEIKDYVIKCGATEYALTNF